MKKLLLFLCIDENFKDITDLIRFKIINTVYGIDETNLKIAN